MPILRKASDGAGTSKPRTVAKPGATAGGRKAPGPNDAKKTPTPAPLAQQAAAPATGAQDDHSMAAVRELIRPGNQLQLTEAELEEEIGRSLTAGNPDAPANIVRYSFKDRGYRQDAIISQQIQHFQLGGCLMHRDSDEAAREQHRQESASLQAQSRRVTLASRRATQAQAETSSADSGVGPAHAEPSAATAGEDGSTQLRNQFNFADRAAQTGHGVPRERGTMTVALPTATASGSCSRWEIFQAYLQDQDRQREQEELARHKAQAARKGHHQQQRAPGTALALVGSEQGVGSTGSPASPSRKAVQLLERMVNQNVLKEVVMDFKYWEDPADAVKQDEGTLLPLWSFNNPRAKHRAVTALCWSPRYFDLFVVGYGSFDFLHPTAGLVCCYSLKNPSHPEYTFQTAAGVMCLDFHPDHPNLLAVGCYDGRVCIFDVVADSSKALYESTPRGGKHSDPVWQVCWQRTDSHELQLCSISTDGRVTLWSVSKNELAYQDLMDLRSLRGRDDLMQQPQAQQSQQQLQEQSRQGTPGSSKPGSSRGTFGLGGSGATSEDEGNERGGGIAGGCCFDFNPEHDYLFIVGSEDGSLYKCSTAYSSEYLQAYRPGHRLPVYAVRWNGLHTRTFLSAGADWKVKLWDSVLPKPVASFDLGAPVGDVAWAPFSSTVFAAVTDSGRVHVFDLEQNRAAGVCAQRVGPRKTRLTKLAFNPRNPVVLVGNEHGSVSCLKLSPNLRRSFNQGALQLGDARLQRSSSQVSAARAAEAERLESVLRVAKKCNQALLPDDWDLM